MEKMDRIKKAIETVLAEHLDSYALIGFDIEGSEISIMHTPTDRDVKAVSTSYREWLDESDEWTGTEAECELEDWTDEGEEWKKE